MDKYGFLLADERHGAGGSGDCVDDDSVLSQDESSACAASTATGGSGGDGDGLARLRASDARRWGHILGAQAPRASRGASSRTGGVGPSSAAAYATSRSKVKYYARRGLPDAMRRKAWTVLTGVDLILRENQGEYEALVRRAGEEGDREAEELAGGESTTNGEDGPRSRKSTVLETIERDIHRTFPKHYLFHGKAEDDVISEEFADSNPSLGTADDEDSGDESDTVDDYNDSIADIAASTGQDPLQVVETKKEMFNTSMSFMTNTISPLNDNEQTGQDENEGRRDSEGGGSDQILGDVKEARAATDSLTADRNGSFSSSAPPSEALGMGYGQGALRRVLRAYSAYDREVGYCQGMNFIAAMFLTFLTEEEAFWLLVVVMNEEPYKLRELFGEDMAGTHEVLYISEKLLAQFLPQLAQHFEEEGVHVSMFVTQWLLTVYTSTFPFELVARVWDSFLVEGWKVVYRVLLALLEQAAGDVANLPFEEILQYFRRFPTTVNGPTIMAGSLRIALKRKHIVKHVNDWRRHAGDGDNAAERSKRSAARFLKRRTSDEGSTGSSGVNSSFGQDRSFPKIGAHPVSTSFLKKTPKEIVVEDLSENLLPIVGAKRFAVLLHHVLTLEECAELIDRAEEHGLEDASIYDMSTNRAHRNCERYVMDDADRAECWYDRLVQALADTPVLAHKLRCAPWTAGNNSAAGTGGLKVALGLNERLRLLRYKQGQFFHAHNDAAFVRGPDEGTRSGETSHVTVLVYLNQKFKGGQTTFQGRGRYYDVRPRTGSVLLFEHGILHEGKKVTQGKKYIVRTDIMYSMGDRHTSAGTTLTQQL